MIDEIIEVFEERLTDDIYERYEEEMEKIYRTECEGMMESSNKKLKELISADIDKFYFLMKTLGKEIDRDAWIKKAFAHIDSIIYFT